MQKTCGGLTMGRSRRGFENMSSVGGKRKFGDGRRLFAKLLITGAFDWMK
jgi:hypothetical protein